MKICLINNLYKPFKRGGAEQIVELSARELRAQGHDVFIISTKPYFQALESNSANYYLNSLFYNLDKIPKFLRLFWHLFDAFDFFTAQRVVKIIKRENPDLIISHNLKGISYLLPLYLKKLGIKYIHLLHDIQLLHPSGLMFYGQEQLLDSSISKAYQAICRKLFSYCNCVVSPSKWLLDLHLSHGYFSDSKNKVIANPFVLREKQFEKSKNPNFKFLFIGQLEEHKGLELLLQAFELFSKRHKATLDIIGDGSQFKKLQANHSHANILFLGKKESAFVLDSLVQYDCLVVPSLCYENSPTVIYEAAAANLPVLAARIGGIAELVHDLGGVLFTPGSVDDLLTKMEYTIDNHDKLVEKAKSKQLKIKNSILEKYIEKILALSEVV